MVADFRSPQKFAKIDRRCNYMSWRVEVDADKCTGDAERVNVCATGVFEMQDEKAVVIAEDECLGCESCIEVCPSGAIEVTEL